MEHCLHRTILEAIGDHFDELGHHHGTPDTIVIDSHEVMRAIAKVAGATLSAIDDDDGRSAALARFLRWIIDDVNDLRARGEQPRVIRPS